MHPDRSAHRTPPTALRLLRLTWECLLFYTALICFGVGGIVFTVVGGVLSPVLPRDTALRLSRQAIGFLFRVFLAHLQAIGLLKLDVRALDALRGGPAMVIAPNHPCLLDAVFVIARIPEAGCIMKAEIWDNPILGGGARLAGYIRNDAPLAMMQQAARELRAGQSLLAFPEGTRTRKGAVNPFRGSFALIAKQARVPVQTVFIETQNVFLSKGWPLLKKPDFPLVYRARLGRRFWVEGSVQQFVTALEGYYREELNRASGAAPDPVPADTDLHEASREQSHA
jgi:1-acyl-sn-glycerol-3-phosphate acyltransferase